MYAYQSCSLMDGCGYARVDLIVCSRSLPLPSLITGQAVLVHGPSNVCGRAPTSTLKSALVMLTKALHCRCFRLYALCAGGGHGPATVSCASALTPDALYFRLVV